MELKNKKVLVAGSGKSGIGAANLLKKVGAVVTIYDGNVKLNKEDILAKLDNKENVDVILGELKEDVIKQFDLMILSPGIAIDAPFVNDVRDNNVPIWGEVELAYVVGKGRLAAITGTNGKTTTRVDGVNKKSLKQTKILKVKKLKNRKVRITFKKVSKAKIYRIQYSTDRKFKKNVRTKRTRKNTYLLRKLRVRKRYYVRVRAIVGKDKGKWSRVKSFKVSKRFYK